MSSVHKLVTLSVTRYKVCNEFGRVDPALCQWWNLKIRQSVRVCERHVNEAKHPRANANIIQQWLSNRVRLANSSVDRAKQGSAGMQRPVCEAVF